MIEHRFEFEGEEYYGIEDFIQRAEIEHYAVINSKTKKQMNVYEYFWKTFRQVLIKAEGGDEYL